jgi:hypothetical protein
MKTTKIAVIDVGSDCIGSGTVVSVTGWDVIQNYQHPDLTVIETS